MNHLLESHYTRYYRDTLGLPDWRERVRRRLGRVEEEENARWLEAHGSLQGRRLLDIGCNVGGLVFTLGLHGADALGIEPDGEALPVASRRVPGRVVRGRGENLPFRDGVFDGVTLIAVLEHTPTPRALLEEAVRVLRPGGVLWMKVPNYLCLSEHHYRVLWFPYLPRPMARLYLRMRGRPTGYLRHIYYRNPLSVKRMLRGLPVEVQDAGEGFLRDKLGHPETIRSPWVRRGARWLARLHLTRWAVGLRLLLGWEIDLRVIKQG